MRFVTVFEKRAPRPIEDWLAQLGLARYADAFVAAEIDLDVLTELTDADLVGLDVKLGDRKRILRASAARRAAPAKTDARAATVIYCDLVDSTELAVRLDPRELRAVMSAYHARCAEVVASHGGEAQYLGGGVMVTFASAPTGDEDAKRAVRCALALLVAIGEPSAGAASLQARIGIATGSEADSSTSSLAARLQRFADPQSVLIADTTRPLLGDAFTLAPLGNRAVVGLADRIDVWRVEPEMPRTDEPPGPAAAPQAEPEFVETHVDDGTQPVAALHQWQEKLERSERLAEPQLRLEALHALWTLAFSLGDLSYTLDVTKRGVAYYDSAFRGVQRERGKGHDAGICAAGYRAMALILTGRIGEGRGWLRRAESAIARSVDSSTRCEGELDAAVARDLLGEFDVAIALAGDARKLACKNDLARPEARAALVSSAARIDMGDRAVGMRALGSVLDRPDAALRASWRGYYLVRLALAEIAAGDASAATARIALAREIADGRGGCVAEAEIERAAAALLRLRGAPRESVMERLAGAAQVARSQDALLLELRAESDSLEFALSFADGAADAARSHIRDLLERIEAGDATFDVRRARMLERRAAER